MHKFKGLYSIKATNSGLMIISLEAVAGMVDDDRAIEPNDFVH